MSECDFEKSKRKSRLGLSRYSKIRKQEDEEGAAAPEPEVQVQTYPYRPVLVSLTF